MRRELNLDSMRIAIVVIGLQTGIAGEAGADFGTCDCRAFPSRRSGLVLVKWGS
jgi:hypothetical protein